MKLAHGTCDLTDNSAPGDWRLPNIRELMSLVDYGNSPALPTGAPFLGCCWQVWSSTTDILNGPRVFGLNLGDGSDLFLDKVWDRTGWAVRDALPPPTQCSDGVDNDDDGWIDLEDHQCRDASQNSEKHPKR